jgi:hypothetical protein
MHLTTIGALKRLNQLLGGQSSSSVAITGGSVTGVTLGLASAVRGTFTCNGVTPVVVSNANITADSQVLITLKTVGGTVGATPAVKTITVSTGFTVAGTASDTSVYNYAIIG